MDSVFLPSTDGRYQPSRFALRVAAYQHIHQCFADPYTPLAATFIGRRSIGKSALLWHFNAVFDDPYIGVYVPLRQLRPQSERVLFRYFAEQIFAAITARGFSIGRLPEIPATPNRAWFQETLLPSIFQTIRGQRRLVLLLDDADYLLEMIHGGDIDRDLWGFLSALIAQYGQLGMVMTLSPSAENHLNELVPLCDPAQVMRLEDLPRDEVAALFELPAESDVTESLLHITGGNPLLLQFVGQAMADQALTVQALTAQLPTLLTQTTPFFEGRWRELTLTERLVLTAISHLVYDKPNTVIAVAHVEQWLAQTDYPTNPTAIRAALRGIEYQQLVRQGEGGIQLRGSLLQLWLLRYARLGGDATGRRRTPVALIAVVIGVLLLAALLFGLYQQNFARQPQVPPVITVTLDSP
jgi:hypothetical protein